MVRLLVNITWLLLFLAALQAQAWTRARRLIEPRRGTSASGARWYEPWPVPADYPSHGLWRVAALSWIVLHVSLVGIVVTTIWQAIRAVA